MSRREFDIVVYGATGFTGRLVAEFLASHHPELNFAMAGRSEGKLKSVRDEIGAPADTPLIVADSDDHQSLLSMSGRAEAVISTVGPYQLYGEPLLRACALNGTDYVDLCGEPAWMKDMIEKYDAQAKESGARLVLSCGFDSVPFDLGVLFLQEEAIRRSGQPITRVKGRVRSMKGTFSGGTAASLRATMQAAMRKPAILGILRDPFALTPGFEGPDQPSGLLPRHEDDLGKWAAPFVMAPINTKNVHRTNFLLGHPYGEDFKYDEMVLTSPGEAGRKMAEAAQEMMKNPFGANPPKPGEGPTKEERESGFYDVLFVAEMPGGETLRYGVKGRYDPGYGSTSRMLAETGIALLSCEADGGIGTPGSFLGKALVDRLQEHAEITFAAED
ncbi:MAG: saccharopine dehydrogenase family protein [Oceanicaulis sp.]